MKEIMASIESLKKINKKIIQDNHMESFERQLLKLMDGKFDVRFPLIISPSSNCMQYIKDINREYPVIIKVSTVLKLRNKHDIGYSDIADIESMLSESVLAFDSLTQDTSKVILLDRFDTETGDPTIAVCRLDKKSALTSVNEITSMYDKKQFQNFIIRAYDQGKTFYKNKKTEQYVKSARLQLPIDLTYALSNDYHMTAFTKCQAERSYQNYLYKKYTISTENSFPHLIKAIPKNDLEYMSRSSDRITRHQIAKHERATAEILDKLKNDQYDQIRKIARKRLLSLGKSKEEIYTNISQCKDSSLLFSSLDDDGLDLIEYNLDLYMNKKDIIFDEENSELYSISNDIKFSPVIIEWSEGLIDTEDLIENYFEGDNEKLFFKREKTRCL